MTQTRNGFAIKIINVKALNAAVHLDTQYFNLYIGLVKKSIKVLTTLK